MIYLLPGMGATSAMYARVDAEFVRAMCVAAADWDGYDGDMQAITRIHGRRDRVIRRPADAHEIPGGGHLIAMTHTEECVAVAREALS